MASMERRQKPFIQVASKGHKLGAAHLEGFQRSGQRNRRWHERILYKLPFQKLLTHGCTLHNGDRIFSAGHALQ